MGIANNDPNWRVPAGIALVENICVTLDSTGHAIVADPGAVATCAVGVCPQAIAIGDRAPIIRQGKISGLSGFSAGATLYLAADGTIDDAVAANPHFTQRVGWVCHDDATTAFIDIQELASIIVTPT